jgi:ribosomal protein S24E
MEQKIIKQEKNPFLNREELVIEIKSDITPSFDEVKKIIGKDENLIVVKKVETNFGKKVFTADAVVYESAEAKDKIETIPKKVRKKMEEDKKAADEAAKAEADAPKEEAPAPAEEPKAEEPKEDKPKAEEPKEDKPKEDKPKEDKPKEDKPAEGKKE